MHSEVASLGHFGRELCLGDALHDIGSRGRCHRRQRTGSLNMGDKAPMGSIRPLRIDENEKNVHHEGGRVSCIGLEY